MATGRGLVRPRGPDRGQGLDPAQGQDRAPVQDQALQLQSVQDRGQGPFRGLVHDPGPALLLHDDQGPDPAAGQGRFRDHGLGRDQDQARQPPGDLGPDRLGPDRVLDQARDGQGLVPLPEKEATRINLFLFHFVFFCENNR